MLRRMLRVDNWLDVASLENVEEDHSFLFLKKNLMKIFFFFFLWSNWKFWLMNFFFGKILELLNFFEGIENFDWWIFFFSFLKIFNFLKELKTLVDEIFIFICFLKILNFLKELKILVDEIFIFILFLNFFLKELKILIDDFSFYGNLRNTSPMPLVPPWV